MPTPAVETTVAPVATAAAPVPQPAVAPVYSSHSDLMAAAGIPSSDWPSAERIVMIESSWNGSAVEPNTGACGLVQELPCGKSGCTPTDNVCELRWGNAYVVSRYGSWYNALQFHLVHGWY
jgi:hypothetical protein